MGLLPARTNGPPHRMSHHPLRTLAAATLAMLSLVLAGCSDTGAADEAAAGPRAATIVKPGAPGERSRVLDPDEVPSVPAVPHTGADVEFVQAMIGHHAQAVVMTALVPERSEHEQLELFVGRMDITQVSEIEQMQQWLEAREEDAPEWDPVFGAQGGHPDGMDTSGEGASMPGMATPEQVEELAAASGEDFDRLFLQLMTQHHLGALEMVDALYADGGGGEPEVFQIASHVQSDQNIEMDRMAVMLAEIDA